MENTTEALEQLLARIGCQVESTPETQTTATRPVDKRRLRLCKPLAKILPDVSRDTTRIDPAVRASIQKLLTDSKPRWPLFMHGGVGCGKTCAALCLADRVPKTLYRSIRELSDEVLSARDGKLWRDAGPGDGIVKVDESAVWRAIDAAPLVVLDELGTRRAGDFELELLKRILDKRTARPTVCLSNQPLDGRSGIAELYDSRIADRLRGGTVVFYPGGSRRGTIDASV